MNTNAGICILVRHSIEICRTSSVKKIKIGITVLLPIEQSECLYVSLNVFLVHSLTSFLTECRIPEISIHTQFVCLTRIGMSKNRRCSNGEGERYLGVPTLGTHIVGTPRYYFTFVLPIPSDTSVERNTLMERVYPRLKSFCQERGYDFQVVDMRWGVRDESTDDHMTTELCMRELRACQKLSTGPNFIVS